MILDLSKKQHIPLINMYKKCKGIALVDKYLPQLTPLNKMYVIDSLEDWKQINGFNYEISSLGNVRSLKLKKNKKLQVDNYYAIIDVNIRC